MLTWSWIQPSAGCMFDAKGPIYSESPPKHRDKHRHLGTNSLCIIIVSSLAVMGNNIYFGFGPITVFSTTPVQSNQNQNQIKIKSKIKNAGPTPKSPHLRCSPASPRHYPIRGCILATDPSPSFSSKFTLLIGSSSPFQYADSDQSSKPPPSSTLASAV